MAAATTRALHEDRIEQAFVRFWANSGQRAERDVTANSTLQDQLRRQRGMKSKTATTAGRRHWNSNNPRPSQAKGPTTGTMRYPPSELSPCKVTIHPCIPETQRLKVSAHTYYCPPRSTHTQGTLKKPRSALHRQVTPTA
ncbi:Hypothetical predicted protein [Pelobates cultripes]|uniref:Uncharacterized protein n=1 Tax=Pelobates cultripes TaxID=61616 RepID=A0AAD1RHB8_PELCU|nr:Hypothetical predicted protein [Pelobates cultripes]